MPGRLWPILFGEKKEIRYIWRSSWLEPKSSITIGRTLLIIILVLIVSAIIFGFPGEKPEKPPGFSKQEQPIENMNHELYPQVNASQLPQPEAGRIENSRSKTQTNQSDLLALNPLPEPKENILNSGSKSELETNQEKSAKVQTFLNRKQILGFGWYYNQLYQDWRFNPGLDLAAANEEEIPAVLAGHVENVLTDHNFDITVIVKTGQYQTYYTQLRSTPLKKDDIIATGDTVGIAGTSSVKKTKDNSSIQLRVKSLESGKYINPWEIFEK